MEDKKVIEGINSILDPFNTSDEKCPPRGGVFEVSTAGASMLDRRFAYLRKYQGTSQKPKQTKEAES